MRTLKFLLLVGLILWLVGSPTVGAILRDVQAALFAQKAAATVTDQETFDRVCPLFQVWVDLDNVGKRRTGEAIVALAEQGARRTEDPAVKAFLATVPVALTDTTGRQAQAARDLVARECAAHGWRD